LFKKHQFSLLPEATQSIIMPTFEVSTMDATALNSLSPLDGRYAATTAPLAAQWSELALMRARLTVEIHWLFTLSEHQAFAALKPFNATQKKALTQILSDFDLKQAQQVKHIEQTTRHDVKAIEYYLQEQCKQQKNLQHVLPFIHFSCTSEDINNLAYGLMLKASRNETLLPAYEALITTLKSMAHQHASCAMVGRTHGQLASPTTLGKECAVFASRLQQALDRLKACNISGKFNGAVGHFNAHHFAYPEIDWPKLSQQFVTQLGLNWQKYTTQIEPHDDLAHCFLSLTLCNTILIDCTRDFWGYIALGYFSQHKHKGQVGSSTMPHKINPINFENAEGNLGIANALAQHFAQKLPISRWQRDLSDSTVMRNQGVALAHTLLAIEQLQQGLKKLTINPEILEQELNSQWQLLAEGIQTLLRKHQQHDAYEALQQLTQGKQLTQETLHQWIKKQHLPQALEQQLLQLTPSQYLGYAQQLATEI
jgi:adenylosuccinate lyase